MPAELSAVIAATTRWLVAAYPAGSPLGAALTEAQARQASTVAAWLRYPTRVDAALLGLVGPGGSDRLDWLVGADAAGGPWRTWVDEVVASWAACLLTDDDLAVAAVHALRGCAHAAVPAYDFGRLTAPGVRDRRAAALLRHPDLVAPVADLHRAELTALLAAPATDIAA